MPIAVSACLLGEPCRYDGKSRPCEDVLKLHDACEMVPVCPEVLGGLPVPHAPCEIAAAERALRVTDADGVDVTDAFLAGAAKTVELAKEQGCKLAVLKAKSPSCGCGLVYDGAFAGELVPGYGVAARALREAGVRVLDEVWFAARRGIPVVRRRFWRRRRGSALRSRPSASCCARSFPTISTTCTPTAAIPPSGPMPDGPRTARARTRACSWR